MTRIVRGRFVSKGSTEGTGKANLGDVVPFGKNEERFGVFEKIISIIKATWPKKTSAHVSHVTGVSERAVQFWLAGETRMSLEHVVALLRTSEGFLVLAAVMGDCKEEWWIEAKLGEGIRQSRRAIAAQQKRIDELKVLQSQIDLFQQ